MTTAELAQLVEGIRFIRRALEHPVDKEAWAAAAEPMRRTFGKSVVAARPLACGTILRQEDLALKKPGDGLPPARLGWLVGKRLKRSVDTDELILEEDVEA